MYELLKTILETKPTDFSIRKRSELTDSPALSSRESEALRAYENYQTASLEAKDEAKNVYVDSLILFSDALFYFIKDDRRLVSEIFLDIILLDQTIIFILTTLPDQQRRIADTYHRIATNLSMLAARTQESTIALSRLCLFHALEYITLAMHNDPDNAHHASFYRTLAKHYIYAVKNDIKSIFSSRARITEEILLFAQKSGEDILQLARKLDKKELLRCVIEIYQTLATHYNAQCRMQTNTAESCLHYANLVIKQMDYWHKCLQVAHEGAIESSVRFFKTQLNKNIEHYLVNLNRYCAWFERDRKFQQTIEINKAIIFCYELSQNNSKLADAYFSMSVAYHELKKTKDTLADEKEYTQLSVQYAEKAHMLFPDHVHHAMRLGSARESHACALKRAGQLLEAIECYFQACAVLMPLLARVKDNAEFSHVRNESYRVLFYCYNNLFFSYFKLGNENPLDINRSVFCFRRGLAMGEEALKLANITKALEVSALAIKPREYIEAYYFFIIYLEKNQPLLVLDEIQQLIEVCIREKDMDTWVQCYDKQASILKNLGRYEDAIKIFEHIFDFTRTQRRQENIAVKNALAACYKYASKDMHDPTKRMDYTLKAERLFREQRKYRKVGEMIYRQMEYADSTQVLTLYAECIRSFLLAIEEDLAGDITLKDITTVTNSRTDTLRSIIETVRTAMHKAYFAQEPAFIEKYKYRREAALYATEGFYEKALELYLRAIQGFHAFATERGMDVGLTDDFLAEIKTFAANSDNCTYLDVTARDVEKNIRAKESIKKAFPHIFGSGLGAGFFSERSGVPALRLTAEDSTVLPFHSRN